jgi:aminopeptidase N
VAIEVDHDPGHATNVARMLDTAAAALDAMQASFGPYPHRQLRIVEVPASWPFAGFALPQTILLREDRAFLTDMRDQDRPDLIARRVAHEVAHQWFGYRLIAANGPGGLAITESLTKYGELLVVERMRGREHVRKLLEIELDRYLAGRAREEIREASLAAVGQQAYLYYSKGAVVLWAIRDLIGPAAMDGAIRGVMTDQRPTGADLARHLRLAAGAKNAALIDQWMNDIVLDDLRIDSVRAQRRADGRFDVTLRVNAAKVRADGRGNETPLPLDEPIEIAIDGEKGVLYSQKQDLRTGMNEITAVVGAPPVSATVDPWVTRIDRNPLDNAKTVDRVSANR